MDRNVKVILDGKEVYGYGGQKILDLCGECGVEIPTLCYDPHLSVHGGCSVCLVDVKGAKALVRACASTIAPGMIIQTNTERVRKARKLALELLFSDHVGDCRPPLHPSLPCTWRRPGIHQPGSPGEIRRIPRSTAQEHHPPGFDRESLPCSLRRKMPQELCR